MFEFMKRYYDQFRPPIYSQTVPTIEIEPDLQEKATHLEFLIKTYLSWAGVRVQIKNNTIYLFDYYWKEIAELVFTKYGDDDFKIHWYDKKEDDDRGSYFGNQDACLLLEDIANTLMRQKSKRLFPYE